MSAARPAAYVAAVAPSALVLVCTCVQAWRDSGSIAAAGAGGWLPYAILTALVVATVLLSGGAARPPRSTALAVGFLLALALWAAISLSWSWVPSLARDEGLLTAFYALALAVPLVSLRAPEQRIAALGVVVGVFAVFVVLVSLKLGFGGDVATRFVGGRLYFPITYANAQGSLFALPFWPAVLLAARRGGGVVSRALATGAAGTFVAGATLAQSKGTAIGIGVSLVVVVALSPARLRLLVPFAIAFVLDALAFRTLTEPFRTPTTHIEHRAALTVLVVGAAGAVAGAAYALVDRRIEVGSRGRRVAGIAVSIAVAAGVVVGVAAFVRAEPHPGRFFHAKWTAFKHLPTRETTSSHFLSLGSNRYDFWRVSLHEFVHHPVAGCGARCFGPLYLVHGHSSERPVRAHSLPIEVAAEQGLVGLALLGAALALVFGRLGRLARLRNAPGTASLGAFAAWFVQACVDWTWTFPAVTASAFLVAGVGCARASGLLAPVSARAAGAIATALAVLAFAPPWLAAKLTDAARNGTASNPTRSLHWARRLDPVSTAPLVLEAQLAPNRRDETRFLRKAATMEPKVVATQYFLGVVLLNSGRRAEARAQLERALRLDPTNVSVRRALALARR